MNWKAATSDLDRQVQHPYYKDKPIGDCLNLDFKGWMKLQEVGTSTASVASFKRISIPMVRRQWAKLLGSWGEEDPFFRRKKGKK